MAFSATLASRLLPPFRINPAFQRFPLEASLIGRLLAGFGELEYLVCVNAGNALGRPPDP